MTETPKTNAEPENLSDNQRNSASPIQESLESKLIADYHLNREEIRVIAEAYKLRRKELFLATRKELQDFINQDYRAANEESLGWSKGVRILQEALKIKVDGRFGPSTFRTLIDFQKKSGLKPDGVAGPRTILELKIADKINGTETPIVEPIPEKVELPVAPPKPSAKKIIDRFEARAKAIQENLDNLRVARDENTGFTNVLIDDARSIFGAETGKAVYEKTWQSIQAETRKSLAELRATIGSVEMTELEQARLKKLDRSYAQILGQELGGPEVIASVVASVKALPDTAIAAGYGVVGMGKWAIDLVTSIFDITIFLVKMVSPKHRKAVGQQWDQLVEMSEKSGGVTGLMSDAFQAEVARVQSLPANQQSEAMGKVAGNVLGMIGIGVGAGKLTQMGSQYMAKSAAAQAAKNTAEAAAKAADTAAKIAKQKVLAAQYMANISNTQATATQSATVAAQELSVHTAEVARQTAEVAKLGTQATLAKTQAISAKAGSIILNGPAEALMTKMTSAAFNKVFLLVQAKKAQPKLLQDALSKAFLDNVEQKKLATAAGDAFKLKELEKQEKFLNEIQEKLNGIPTLLDTNISAPKSPRKPVTKISKNEPKGTVKPEIWSEPHGSKTVDTTAQSETAPKSEPIVETKVDATSPLDEAPKTVETPKPVEAPKPKIAKEKIAKSTQADTQIPEAPIHFPTEFIYNEKGTLTSNVRKFRQVFNPDRVRNTWLSEAEYKKVELWIASFNRVHDTMKQAKNSGNVVALERATQDLESFLKDPEAGVQMVVSGKYGAETSVKRESTNSSPDNFLKNMFHRYYTELVEKFSPARELAGSPKHIEQLLTSDVLTLLKEAMEAGRITPNEALTNIHSLRTGHRAFIETTLGIPFEAALARRTDAWRRAQSSSARGWNGTRNGR